MKNLCEIEYFNENIPEVDGIFINDDVLYIGIDIPTYTKSINGSMAVGCFYGDIDYFQKQLDDVQIKLVTLFEHFELNKNDFGNPEIISILHFL
jgi:hypothetical protein